MQITKSQQYRMYICTRLFSQVAGKKCNNVRITETYNGQANREKYNKQYTQNAAQIHYELNF